jgi:sulfonate transport system substrate-binding protein
MSKRLRLLTGCELLLCLILSGCHLSGCHDHSSSPSQITIGTFSHAIDYSPFYVAKHFGWFEAAPELHGIKINYKEFNDRAEISAAIQSGQLDAIFAAEPPIILTSAQGNDIRIVEDSCTLQQEIVVRSSLPIHSVVDLRHRTIAVLLGTSSHYGLFKILRAAHLDPDKDVQIRYMGPDEARAAFESGQIDAWAVWPPFVEQEEVSGAGRVLTGGDAVINSVMAIPEDVLIKDEPIARAMVTVIQQSKEWIRKHPDEAENVVASELRLNLSVIQAAWGKHDWSAHLTDPVLSDIQQKADFLAEQKLTRNNKDVQVRRDLVDLRYTLK